MTGESKPNIYQRINAVMQEISYVQKDIEVSGGGKYKAVTHDMVTAVTRPHFVKHGIAVVPRLIEGQVVDTGRKTSSGTPIIRYEGRYEVSFVNVDEPTDACVLPLSAHAEDQGDKAPGKCISYAVKMAILKVLLLESGENDEGRMPEAEEPEPLSEEEVAGLKGRLNKCKDRGELRKALKDCFAVAEKAHDKGAHAVIKAYAMDLANNLPEPAKAAA